MAVKIASRSDELQAFCQKLGKFSSSNAHNYLTWAIALLSALSNSGSAGDKSTGERIAMCQQAADLAALGNRLLGSSIESLMGRSHCLLCNGPETRLGHMFASLQERHAELVGAEVSSKEEISANETAINAVCDEAESIVSAMRSEVPAQIERVQALADMRKLCQQVVARHKSEEARGLETMVSEALKTAEEMSIKKEKLEEVYNKEDYVGLVTLLQNHSDFWKEVPAAWQGLESLKKAVDDAKKRDVKLSLEVSSSLEKLHEETKGRIITLSAVQLLTAGSKDKATFEARLEAKGCKFSSLPTFVQVQFK